MYKMKKMSGIVSFRKNILVWLGDRTTASLLLVQALYRSDHQAVQTAWWSHQYNAHTKSEGAVFGSPNQTKNKYKIITIFLFFKT